MEILVKNKGGRPRKVRPEPLRIQCAKCPNMFLETKRRKVGGGEYLCPSCTAKAANAKQGHMPAIEGECGYCGQPVKRYASRTTGAETGNVYCSREHFQAARVAKQNVRRGRKTT